jgi:hypothetical protein
MPVMLLLPFLPLATVLMSMVVLTTVKFNQFECTDIVKDTLDGDVCWCYENGGFGCCCCTVCHDAADDAEPADDADDDVYDDSADSFHKHVYAKKS